MMPQSARIWTIACRKLAVPLEDFHRECGRVILSVSPRRSRYTGPSSFSPSCMVQRPGVSTGRRSGYGAVSPTLLALHLWHQMARLYFKRSSPQESRPAQHRVNFASGAAALGWPRHKVEDIGMLISVFVSELQEGKCDRGALGKRYTDQLKRQLAQAGINIQSWQQEASDRDSWRSSVRKVSRKFEAERHEAEKRKDVGGRKSEQQYLDHSQPKPSPVQSVIKSASQEPDSTATSERARTDHQPSKKLPSARNQPSSTMSFFIFIFLSFFVHLFIYLFIYLFIVIMQISTWEPVT